MFNTNAIRLLLLSVMGQSVMPADAARSPAYGYRMKYLSTHQVDDIEFTKDGLRTIPIMNAMTQDGCTITQTGSCQGGSMNAVFNNNRNDNDGCWNFVDNQHQILCDHSIEADTIRLQFWHSESYWSKSGWKVYALDQNGDELEKVAEQVPSNAKVNTLSLDSVSTSAAPTTAAPTTAAPTTAAPTTAAPTTASPTTAAPTTAAPTQAPAEVSTQGDPIILGLNNQVFKFEGRNEAWYANIANQYLFWNMQFREFNTCPLDENMFITGMSLSTFGDNTAKILIVTTPEPIEECRVNPNAICLGEGTLHVSFDSGNTFVSQPGDYHYGSPGRIVAHNTYAACSRKWHDYDVAEQEGRNLREGSRRMSVAEKKPLELLADKKMTMIDAEECGAWIDDRVNNSDLFQQKGHWSTLYIETDVASFHVEYRRSDWFNRRCDFQSLDAWMTKVDGKMEKVEWNGILGETKKKIYDASTGEQVLSDRMKLLGGKDDADYEVDGPFGKTFGAITGLGAIAASTS